jgi:hypothetical protein
MVGCGDDVSVANIFGVELISCPLQAINITIRYKKAHNFRNFISTFDYRRNWPTISQYLKQSAFWIRTFWGDFTV